MAAMQHPRPHSPAPRHAFSYLNARERDGVNLHARRSVLKAGLAGMAGLSLADLMQLRAKPLPPARRSPAAKV